MNRFTPSDLEAKGYVQTGSGEGWVKGPIIYPIPPAMPKATPKPANTPITPQKGRLRQNTTGLNKTEQAFKKYMQPSVEGVLLDQAITLKIANGCRYTPDFVLIEMPNVAAYEVKGFMRDDAAVKLKVAASLYPWIRFHLVTRKKGEWLIQEILP